MKLISFSLFGNNPKYTRGILKNAELKKVIYADYTMIVFHNNSVEQSILNELASAGAVLRNVDGCGVLPASWRFMAHDEPEATLFISRDADSRISKREEEAVMEWESSGKILHVMRDHPHHGGYRGKQPILGGMWGMKMHTSDGEKVFSTDFRTLILNYQGGLKYTEVRAEWFWTDMNFLRDCVYSKLGAHETCMVHAACDYMDRVQWRNEGYSRDFPSPIGQEKHFIGESFTFDDLGAEVRERHHADR